MKVKEYLDTVNFFEGFNQVTFIKARARKDAHSPFYHAEYQTTPIFSNHEMRKDNKLLDYYVLNNHQPPIDWLSGAPWKHQFENGHLISLLVISKEDLTTLYSPEQAVSMIEYIDKVIKGE